MFLLLNLSAEGVCASREISVGLMVDAAGPTSMIGAECRHGFEAARGLPRRNAGGAARVRMVYADHKGESRTAVSEFQKLVELDKVLAVITHRSQITMALNALSRREALPLLGVAGQVGFVDENEYAFRFWPSAALEGRALARRALAEGRRKFVILSGEDEYTDSMRREFRRTILEEGGSILADDTATPDELDFRSLLLKAAFRQADAVFVNLLLPQIGPFLKRLHEQRIPAARYSNFWGASPRQLEVAGAEAVQGTALVQADFNGPGFLAAAGRVESGTAVSAVTWCCFTALAAVLQAVDERTGISTPREMYQALLEIDQVQLPDGPIKLVNREAQYGMQYNIYRDGRLAAVR